MSENKKSRPTSILHILYHRLRITELFELEGFLKGHLVQLPCNKQGQLQLGHVAQSPIQSDLECLHGQIIQHLSGQHVPLPHHPYGRKLLPYNPSKSSFYNLKPFHPVLLQQTLQKNLSHLFRAVKLYFMLSESFLFYSGIHCIMERLLCLEKLHYL